MISIIIPLYNKVESITKTIQCVLNQTFIEFEIVIVNDGSTDGSEEKVAQITDSRIKLINKQNGGVSSARNLGIKEAKYEYISFLDADDYWEPTYLEELVKLIADYYDAGIWGLGYGLLLKGTKIRDRIGLKDNFRGFVENIWETGAFYWTGSTTTTTKTVLNKVGTFDERMTHGEDLDLWYRILLEYKAVFYNKTLAYYILDSENRAMHKAIPFDKHIPFYIEKYSDYRKNNVEFRKYFDREMLYRLFPYAVANTHKKDLKRVLNQIDFSLQKKSFKLRFMFPKLYNLYFKLK